MRLVPVVPLLMALVACGRGEPRAPASSGSIAPAARMPALDVRQVGEGKTWLLRAPVVYRAATGDSLVVPAGFVSELASVPRWFHPYLTPVDAHAGPAVVHDYLYWTARCTRAEADAIFLRAMREQQVSDTLVGTLHESAVAWGGTAWRTYERDRERGVARFVPAGARPDGALETWAQYRSYLTDSLPAAAPAVVASAGLCALGRE